MKAMKKLIPTICMLLVSAVLLGTSTYAWFSMNTQVQASGMKVKATTPISVEISQNTDSGWAFTTEFTGDAKVLEPTYYDATTKKFYVPTAINKIKADGKPTVAFDATNTDNWTALEINQATGQANGLQYLAVYDMYVRTNVGTEDSTQTPVDLNCAAAIGGNSNLKNAVKVGIIATDGTVTEIGTVAGGKVCTAALSSATVPYTSIRVIIWYDGSHDDVVNAKADLKETTVTLTFNKVTA